MSAPNSTNALSALEEDATKITGGNTNNGTSTINIARTASTNDQQAMFHAFVNSLPSDQRQKYLALI